MLLARTNWDVPKHRGITYFALEMDQPGITVRPLRQMNGYASFNEVFLNDARVPAADVIGEIDQGWTVALTTLAHERRLASLRGETTVPGAGRTLDEYREEQAHVMEPYVWYPQRAGRVDLVVKRAQETGRGSDPVVRQDWAQVCARSLSEQGAGAPHWLHHFISCLRLQTSSNHQRPWPNNCQVQGESTSPDA